jgi:eukaryotic-like serine/threonine-protein kinase
MSAWLSGKVEESRGIIQNLLRTSPEPDAIPAYAEALAFPLGSLSMSGSQREAAALLARMEQACATLVDRDVLTRAWLSTARGSFGHYLDDRPWRTFLHVEEGSRLFGELGLERNQAMPQTFVGMALGALGEVAGAEKAFHEALAIAHQLRQPYLISYVRTHRALVLAWSPEEARREEARDLALDCLKSELPNPVLLGRIHISLSKVAMDRGERAEAEAQARRACALLSIAPPYRLLARTVLGASLLAQGRITEAREEARRGVVELEQMGGVGFAAVRSYLALAEACFADGDIETGESVLRQALRCLRARAGDIPDLALRERFLRQIPEHARTLELASQRWGEHEAAP